MQKLNYILCVVTLAFAVSCDPESVEPLQEPVPDPAEADGLFLSGKLVELNNKTPLLIVMQNGKEVSVDLNSLDPNAIASIDVLQGKSAEKYGELGKDGVLIVTLEQ